MMPEITIKIKMVSEGVIVSETQTSTVEGEEAIPAPPQLGEEDTEEQEVALAPPNEMEGSDGGETDIPPLPPEAAE